MKTNTGKVRIPKQKRSIEKKNAIIVAAIDLFSEKGIYNTNSKEIALKAGVSIGSFYSYFADKKSLFMEVLEFYLNRHFDMIWNQTNQPEFKTFSREMIQFFLDNLLKAYAVAPEFHRQTHSLRYTDSDVKKLYDKEFEKEIEMLTAILISYSDELGDININAAAVNLHSSAENFAHTVFFKTIPVSEADLKEEYVEMLYRWLKR